VSDIKVGAKVRFLGWVDPGPGDELVGVGVGDIGVVTEVEPGIKHPTWNVDFPTQDRQFYNRDMIYYPGEIELVEEDETVPKG
jgi:hypothetical protein